jgi:hypothetical protein
MITLFKKTPTVEEIHAEFDNAENKILAECEKILSELQIPTQTQIERKSNLMLQLGFKNSETVKQAEELEKQRKIIENTIKISSKQAEKIKYFKQKYPLQKFITINELERICNKYNLIHAPIANYIKDVPEKNLLEIKNCKKLDQFDIGKNEYIIFVDDYYVNCPKELKNVFKNGLKIQDEFFNSELPDSRLIEYAKKFGDYKGNHNEYFYTKARFIKLDRKGYFIAAPKSHFDLKDLKKKSKFGFFKTEIISVQKDPVVFEYCTDDICRIITKWGTDDDQSYLDPSLTNEILN